MMRLAICDDSKLAVSQLQDFIYSYSQQKGNLLTIKTFCSSNELLSALKQGETFDFYFLDIIMPGISGMDLAQEIRTKDESSSIVFVTTSPEYALASYDVEAFSYLLKPINPLRLSIILDKLILNKKSKVADGILVKEKGTLRNIPYYSIKFVEVKKDKLFYHLNTGESIECYGTLKDIEKKLLAYPQFTKPHRSFLVNMNYIQKLDAKELQMTDCQSIVPISQGNLSNFKAEYTAFLRQSIKNKNQ
ncbi:two-component response regulator [Lachnospiraceae bacterium KM106-2]|nr:two-component response regulator [Lachnospiraceae bacterium KM106-2]